RSPSWMLPALQVFAPVPRRYCPAALGPVLKPVPPLGIATTPLSAMVGLVPPLADSGLLALTLATLAVKAAQSAAERKPLLVALAWLRLRLGVVPPLLASGALAVTAVTAGASGAVK